MPPTRGSRRATDVPSRSGEGLLRELWWETAMGGGDGKQRKLGELWQGLAGGAGGRFLSERWPAQTPSSCSSTGGGGARGPSAQGLGGPARWGEQ